MKCVDCGNEMVLSNAYWNHYTGYKRPVRWRCPVCEGKKQKG